MSSEQKKPNRAATGYRKARTFCSRLVNLVNIYPSLFQDKQCFCRYPLSELPEYDKANSGVLVAEKIGLQTMKAKCSHFRTWVELLEGLAKAR